MIRFGSARWRLAITIAITLAALVLASCSSDDDGSNASDGSTSPTTVAFAGASPSEIMRPAVEGKGMNLPQPTPPLPDGYVEEEFFIGGTATKFDAVDTPDNGAWTAEPAGQAKYRTRVIVRRPPAEKFSGTVVLEWFNVSALESSPDWAFLSEEIGRERDVYIGVSTQAQGVEGGDTLLDVDVDEKTASSFGASTDKSGLKRIDPERYGSLVHPGDAYAYDIFTQVGRAASDASSELLGGLKPKQVLAVGESQSAAFLTTLVNAIHPLDPVFDGFLIHSRGGGGAPIEGRFVSDRDRDASSLTDRGVHVRTDLDVPVLLFETETDLTLLRYASARQRDTENVRTWEAAGTAHADAHLIRAVIGGPRDPGVGSFLGCEDPVNTGPQHEVLSAAFKQFVQWSAGGDAPAKGTRIDTTRADETGDVAIERDEHDIALGGVRNPLVDVPVAALTGDPPGDATLAELAESGSGICALFGETIPFDKAKLVDLYGTADNYVAQFRASADTAVAGGFLLRPDADELIAEAEANRALFD
jgi:hypothetical protein